MKRHIPNCITLTNFLCGVLAITALLLWKMPWLASLFIVLGAVADFFDGMVARLLKVSGPVGKELDSLADVVTFGVAPSLIAVSVLLHQQEQVPFLQLWGGVLCYVPLFMAAMSCYRLAKFNVDTRQTTSFIGLATPANALLWLSIPLMEYVYSNDIHLWGIHSMAINTFLCHTLSNAWFVLTVSVIMGFMLVSELPMFSLKFKNLKFRDNIIRFVFLAISLILIILFNVYAIAFIVLIYIVLAITDDIIKRSAKHE